MNSFARKICLLGDFSVGKTSAVARYVRSTFSESYLTTVGVKVDTKVVDLVARPSMRLVLWDIAGSSKLGQSRLNYVAGAHGFVLVADGTRRDTVSSALDLWQQAAEALNADVPAVLLVNKVDLADEWDISPELIESLSHNLAVFCTSAKTGESIELAFAEIAGAVSL
ncbi:Rab family GTPase [Montanilutibacter psychrotolerans]|uniref:GTP-binding protein n=1 Tax=Montanilutibacter psychrotolerans TaxID=1327343 RepID=A0A3M8SVA8_9GAMM|nr:Rab family GTPase [Lysobacter psychrotolerans]RNF85229.1 GTP-binding protein [Lysobacter psychrotolerans]